MLQREPRLYGTSEKMFYVFIEGPSVRPVQTPRRPLTPTNCQYHNDTLEGHYPGTLNSILFMSRKHV